MRVLQLIDSLEAGGAERVSVNLANALTNEIEASFLCATRKEGDLKGSINTSVKYLYLNKKRTIDVMALIKLYRFIRENKINVIHAHSTSYFLATLIKFLLPKLRLVAHFHLGSMDTLSTKKLKPLKMASRYFDAIICVNEKLLKWARKNVKNENVACLVNFAEKDSFQPETFLKGKKGKRILHVSNLRPEKDHFNMLNAFNLVVKEDDEVTLHCVGKNFNDEYAESVLEFCSDLGLDKNVFFYGSRKDVSNIISQSDICVLSSKSEGLPVSLIEYGLHEKPVVVTNVGDCDKIVFNKQTGIVVNAKNGDDLASGLRFLLSNKVEALQYGVNLKKNIEKQFSKDKYIDDLLKIYDSL